jgi:hypothetical protein
MPTVVYDGIQRGNPLLLMGCGWHTMSANKNTVQARVPTYHKWVIDNLAETGGGTFALNPSSVLADMIRDWILGHEELLRTRHLDEANFRKPTPVKSREFASDKQNRERSNAK